MSTVLRERPAHARAGGGAPARRTVIRWAWRLFRREWRQQLLVLALITVAVAATVVAAAVATNTPPPANAGFGTAKDLASFPGSSPHLAAQIAALRHRFGQVEVIENQTVTVPGSVETYKIRAQDPHGPFGQPMLSLVSGHYPTGPGQVAMTSSIASAFGLRTGDVWHAGGTARRLTGIVENPQNLLDRFALVAPGQVRAPTQVTVLFDAPPGSLHRGIRTPTTASSRNVINPQTIVLAADTLGMLLIALVAVGGFTVLAQRRLRSLGMLGAQGATDSHVRLVVRANGLLAGIAGTLTGAALGLAAWLAYRPRVEASAHHRIGAFHLPWAVLAAAMVLAVAATFLAASRPARSVSRVPIVAALSGRPAPPKRVRRWSAPAAVIFLAAAFFLLTYAGGQASRGGGVLEFVAGFVALVVAVILVSPLCLAALAMLGRRAPLAVRLALRDLARYRARSGSALGAISLGVLIAAITCVAAAARYSNPLDYVGPNLAPNQLIVHEDEDVPTHYVGPGAGPPGGQAPHSQAPPSQPAMTAAAHRIATALGSQEIIQLETTGAMLQHAAAGRQFSGPLYVATPQLLRAFGIGASQVSPAADILTMRPGLAGTSKMQLIHGNPFGSKGPPRLSPGSTPSHFPCPASACLASPVIQTVDALPPGTSAPNTVITEHAVRGLHLKTSTAGWLIQAAHPLTAVQISDARLAAAAAGLTVETRSSVPSLAEIIDTATACGILLALAILAMTIGLLRSETASDLRTLAATGASGTTRRSLTAATAGALALTGAVLGTAAGYVAAVAWFRANHLDGLSSLGSVPVANLLIILVGMPLAGAAAAWLLAGREPPAISHQPIE